LRVISGNNRGKKLIAPEGSDVRPTENRTKESLFNILSPLKQESVVLDLFAGSGAIGIEFLSRGAKVVYFVDNSLRSINTVKENLNNTRLTNRSEILMKDAITALEQFIRSYMQFDYIFIDPPFMKVELIEQALNLISEGNILNVGGIIIVEQSKEVVLLEQYNNILKYDYRKYGKRALSFYKTEEVKN